MSDTKLTVHSTHSNESKTSKTSTASKAGVKKKKKVSIALHENVIIRVSDIGIVQTSPSELELQIQAGRILYILDKAISKLQVAATLPELLRNNACTLLKYLSPQEVEFIQGVCARYTGETATSRSHATKSSTFQELSVIIAKINLPEAKVRSLHDFRMISRLIDKEHLCFPFSHLISIVSVSKHRIVSALCPVLRSQKYSIFGLRDTASIASNVNL